MSRPQRPWFRFYVEAIHDRKLRRLTPAQRWLWVAVLAAARQSPQPGVLLVSDDQAMDATDIADLAGMRPRDVEVALPLFEAAGMMGRWKNDPGRGTWYVTNWAERQFESDDVTQRTRLHRSREQDRNVPNTFPGTPPETETDLVKDLSPVLKPRGRGARPPTDVGPAPYHGQNCKCEKCKPRVMAQPPSFAAADADLPPRDPEAGSRMRGVQAEMAERWGKK